LGFWRGNYTTCIRIIPHKGILFSCNDSFKELLGASESSSTLSPLISLAAGSLSGLVASFFTYPLDLVRTRLSAHIGPEIRYEGILRTFRQIAREEGMRAFYKGVGPTLAGAVPYEGIKFASYDLLRHYADDLDVPVNDLLSKVVCGGGAGMAAALATYPNDTVRRRLQLQGAGGASLRYSSALDCYSQIFRNEGLIAFYRGLTPTLLRAIPNMGIQFASYDYLRACLKGP
jgi:hypothetical protein